MPDERFSDGVAISKISLASAVAYFVNEGTIKSRCIWTLVTKMLSRFFLVEQTLDQASEPYMRILSLFISRSTTFNDDPDDLKVDYCDHSFKRSFNFLYGNLQKLFF